MTTPPLIFDKYHVLHRLAVGGMGEVFIARQVGISGFERLVILKSLLPELALERGFVEQFLDEARVAATLNHPNIVSIYEVGLWKGTYFIAMEFIRGKNLSQLQRRARELGTEVPLATCVRVFAEAARGLHHAHSANDSRGQPLHIVHRDISPQNIMVRQDGVTKVVDFGIARAANRESRTATGIVKGKLAYLAPEQISSTGVSGASDQWALGVCLWEMLEGARLFRGENDLVTMRNVLEAPIPAPRRAPPELSAIVLRMLERDPSKRFVSCGAAAEALEALFPAMPGSLPSEFMGLLGDDTPAETGEGSPLSVPSDFIISLEKSREAGLRTATRATPEPAAPPPKRRSGLAVIAVAVAIVAALALILASGSGPREPTASAGVDAGPSASASQLDSGGGVTDLDAGSGGADAEVDVDAGHGSDAGVARDGGRKRREAAPPRVLKPVLVTVKVAGGRSVPLYIDGERHQETPLEVPLMPGRHEIRIERDGRSEREVINLLEGTKTKDVMFE